MIPNFIFCLDNVLVLGKVELVPRELRNVKFFYQVAVRAVPYHKDFVTALKKDASVSSETLYGDMQAALTPLRETINELNRFYTLRGQHSDDTV